MQPTKPKSRKHVSKFGCRVSLRSIKRLQNICASQLESEGSEDDGGAMEGQESSSAAVPVCQQSEAAPMQESEVLPDGPLSFEQMFEWPARFLQKLLDMEACDLVQANLKSLKSVVLTTSFSGVGSPEVALSMIARRLEEMGIWDSDTVRVYSACEKDVPCQGVLTSHVGTCRPEHATCCHMLRSKNFETCLLLCGSSLQA